jgi:threonine/homoserine/homoserine lactone efflux protein
MTLDDAATALLLNFAFGYLALNAVPGPNMLAIGSRAALAGIRGVLPVCFGVAAGAGALAAGLHFAFDALTLQGFERTGRMIGAALLLVIALQAALAPRPIAAAPEARIGAKARVSLLGFAAGFATAAGNPATAAYFLSQFLGPLAGAGTAGFAIGLVALQALAWSVLVAAVFAQPFARRIATQHHRAVCLASGTALALLGVAMLAPLLP